MKLTVHQVPKSDVFSDSVRVHYSHRPEVAAGRIMRVCANGKVIRAVARSAIKNDRGGVWLDDAMRKYLGVRDDKEADFEFKPPTVWDEWIWAWHASNAVTRVAARISLISLFLGVLGLVLGVWSLCLSLRPN